MLHLQSLQLRKVGSHTCGVTRRALLPHHRNYRQQGVSLIEVLVSVVVLSVGLLGMAALQGTALNANHSSYMRSQVVNLGNDMADRMRVNRQAALDGDYDFPMDTTPPTISQNSSLADRDLAAWTTALANTLPAGQGAIAQNGTVFTITIRWQDARRGNADDVVDLILETAL